MRDMIVKLIDALSPQDSAEVTPSVESRDNEEPEDVREIEEPEEVPVTRRSKK